MLPPLWRMVEAVSAMGVLIITHEQMTGDYGLCLILQRHRRAQGLCTSLKNWDLIVPEMGQSVIEDDPDEDVDTREPLFFCMHY